MPMKLPNISRNPEVHDLIRHALAEDIGSGDATSLALVPKEAQTHAVIISRDDYTISGTDLAALVFRKVSTRIQCRTRVPDGKRAKSGQIIQEIRGPAGAILTAERTALNFLQRMTGIATLTRAYADRIKGTKAVILDTRKTTPGLRHIEKYAVLCGGGRNHRIGLYDRILIKDNHRRLWKDAGHIALDDAIRKARTRYPKLMVEVEVENEAELCQALKARPEWVLLDNMSTKDMKKCVRLCRGISLVEASGGIGLKNVAAVAATGVDAISIGRLTHSAPAADLSLEIL